jgi:hypothetical protein
MMHDIHVKLNPGLPPSPPPQKKQHSTRRRPLTIELALNLKKNLLKLYIWSIAF